MSVTILDHALIQHKLTIMRDKDTKTIVFKDNLDEIAMLMAYDTCLFNGGKRNGSTNYSCTYFTCRNWFS